MYTPVFEGFGIYRKKNDDEREACMERARLQEGRRRGAIEFPFFSAMPLFREFAPPAPHNRDNTNSLQVLLKPGGYAFYKIYVFEILIMLMPMITNGTQAKKHCMYNRAASHLCVIL